MHGQESLLGEIYQSGRLGAIRWQASSCVRLRTSGRQELEGLRERQHLRCHLDRQSGRSYGRVFEGTYG